MSKLCSYQKINGIKEFCDCKQCRKKAAFVERKFKPGMSWDNYGQWHIDRILPLSLVKTEEDVSKLCNISNLQPLLAIENLEKGNKVEPSILLESTR